jgi:hypothetical protein
MSEIQMEPEEVKNEPKEKEDLVKSFKDYFTKIISFKFGFKKYYFTRKMPGMKFYANIHLEIILQTFRKLIEKYDLMADLNDSDSRDSSTDSPLLTAKEEVIEVNVGTNVQTNKPASPKEQDFISNLYKFQSIIEVLINIGPYEMFREVKSMILTEFETTALAIQKYLEKINSEKDMKLFTCLTQKILFIVSLIVFKLDYYTITVNCLVEKLNRFFIDFVTRAKDSKQNNFVRCLNLVQKFIKIKKNYMTDFCMSTVTNNKAESMFNFAFNKFCSFGRYFFNNLYLMMDNDIKLIPRRGQRSNFKTKIVKELTPKTGCPSRKESSKLPPRHSRSQTCVTKYLIKDDICTLDGSTSEMGETRKKIKCKTIVRRRSKFGRLNPEMDKLFKIYFISKLAKWKYVSVNTSGQKKEEICRICEKTYKIDNFILHLFYCKEQKLYIQNYNEMRNELNKCLEKLNKYKE